MSNVHDGPWQAKQISSANVADPKERAYDKRMTDLTRQEVDAKLGQNKAEVDARLANFDTSVKTGFAELRTDFAKMQSEMHKNTTDLIKWGIVTALGFATATIAILTFVINNATPKQAPAQSQPVVIYAQPAAALQVPAAAPPPAK